MLTGVSLVEFFFFFFKERDIDVTDPLKPEFAQIMHILDIGGLGFSLFYLLVRSTRPKTN